ALVADIDAGAGDQLLDLALRLPAEAAEKLFVRVGRPCHASSPRDLGLGVARVGVYRPGHRHKVAVTAAIGHFDDRTHGASSFACPLRILQERTNASASNSTLQRGSSSPFTTTIVAAGRASPNASPCTR